MSADIFADALAKHWVPYLRESMFSSHAIYEGIMDRAWNRSLFRKTKRGFKVLVKERPAISGGNAITVPLSWK